MSTAVPPLDGLGSQHFGFAAGYRWLPELVQSSDGRADDVTGCKAYLDLRGDGTFVCYDAANTSSGRFWFTADELVLVAEVSTLVMLNDDDTARSRLNAALETVLSSRTTLVAPVTADELWVTSREWTIAFHRDGLVPVSYRQ